MASIWLAAYKYLTLSGLNWKRRIIEVSYEITVQVMCGPVKLPGHVRVPPVGARDLLCVGWRKEAGHKAEPLCLSLLLALFSLHWHPAAIFTKLDIAVLFYLFRPAPGFC